MRHEKLYLTDILEACDAVESFCSGVSLSSLKVTKCAAAQCCKR